MTYKYVGICDNKLQSLCMNFTCITHSLGFLRKTTGPVWNQASFLCIAIGYKLSWVEIIKYLEGLREEGTLTSSSASPRPPLLSPSPLPRGATRQSLGVPAVARTPLSPVCTSACNAWKWHHGAADLGTMTMCGAFCSVRGDASPPALCRSPMLGGLQGDCPGPGGYGIPQPRHQASLEVESSAVPGLSRADLDLPQGCLRGKA
jgi:hypothetical protein